MASPATLLGGIFSAMDRTPGAVVSTGVERLEPSARSHLDHASPYVFLDFVPRLFPRLVHVLVTRGHLFVAPRRPGCLRRVKVPGALVADVLAVAGLAPISIPCPPGKAPVVVRVTPSRITAGLSQPRLPRVAATTYVVCPYCEEAMPASSVLDPRHYIRKHIELDHPGRWAAFRAYLAESRAVRLVSHD